jgi:hypothetical protein
MFVYTYVCTVLSKLSHMSAFLQHYDLIDDKETTPLQELIDSLLGNTAAT